MEMFEMAIIIKGINVVMAVSTNTAILTKSNHFSYVTHDKLLSIFSTPDVISENEYNKNANMIIILILNLFIFLLHEKTFFKGNATTINLSIENITINLKF